MGDQYFLIGANIEDAVRIVDAGGNPVTGLVQANFTITVDKDGVGNQSTAGITLTEIDATNNKGWYYLLISGSTGFPAAAGVYNLTVFVTATVWEGGAYTYRVNSTGTGGGSSGTASFTPVAANGRVVSSAVALAGATVRITLNTTPSVILYQGTTDVNGLWSTFYTSTNGTYTINVTKTGYTVATASITVAGGVATGPGTDISLAVASTTSSIVASSLTSYVRRRWLDATGPKSDIETYQVVNEAIEMVCMEREWPYYETRGIIDVQPTQSITFNLTSGAAIVSLTTGTLPTWAASGELRIGTVWYTVLSRDSNTQLTLAYTYNGTSIAAGAGTLAQIRYTLPSDVVRIDDTFLGLTWGGKPRPISASKLETLKDLNNIQNIVPMYYAIEQGYILLWPLPNVVYRVNLLYYRKPAILSNPTDTLDWDPLQIMVLRRALDYIASTYAPCVAGTPAQCFTAYEEAISRALSWDKTAADLPSPDDYNVQWDPLRGLIQ